ncbi:MAG: DUF4911 domain-containing protein [Aquificae bacterium]|nr:DUF4911 domain-containing protein [Aquificota bacterium]
MRRYSGHTVKAKVIKVRLPVEEMGLFNALVDGLPRLALTRAKERGKGEVYVLAPPYRLEELMEALEGMKKHIRGLEILGETEEEPLF